MTTSGGVSYPSVASESIDRENVCFTYTATGDEVHHGTIRHDDSLPAPGWVLFDQNMTPVAASEPGLEFVSCDECCAVVLAEGCISDSGGGGRWVSIRSTDGTITIENVITGATVAPADALAICPPTESETRVRTVAAGQSFNIPTVDLLAWSVRSREGAVTVTVNGDATVLDVGEVLAAAAQENDRLVDTVTVAAGAAPSSARVVYHRVV